MLRPYHTASAPLTVLATLLIATLYVQWALARAEIRGRDEERALRTSLVQGYVEIAREKEKEAMAWKELALATGKLPTAEVEK